MISVFDNIFPDKLYHTYIVEGDPQISSVELFEYLIHKGEISINSPDNYIQLYDSFNIDDGRKIKEWHSEKGMSGNKRICIIGAKFINHEAERALLKIIEEPSFNTHFFIIVPNTLVLLDTIISRSHVVRLPSLNLGEEDKINDDLSKIAEEFVLINSKKRIDLITKIIKEYKDEENSNILRFIAIKFINQIEKIFYLKFKKEKNNNSNNIFEELQKSRDFLNLPGASVKMILENLALYLD